jgi:GrpB-like predicted nucleotidyltransferase (UPF0157 family)
MSDDAVVHIAPYDERWPAQFEAERDLLGRVLGPWLIGSIEHVGSTAVPGLEAKPVIDIMAAVRSLDESRTSLSALHGIGYQYAPYRTDVMHWFCKPMRHSAHTTCISFPTAARSGRNALRFVTTSVQIRRWPPSTRTSKRA